MVEKFAVVEVYEDVEGGLWKLLDFLTKAKEAINMLWEIFSGINIQGSFA